MTSPAPYTPDILKFSLSNIFRKASYAQLAAVFTAVAKEIEDKDGQCHAYIVLCRSGNHAGTLRDLSELTEEVWNKHEGAQIWLSPTYMPDLDSGAKATVYLELYTQLPRGMQHALTGRIEGYARPATYHADFIRTHDFGMRRRFNH